MAVRDIALPLCFLLACQTPCFTNLLLLWSLVESALILRKLS
jgi:hypothetical protein